MAPYKYEEARKNAGMSREQAAYMLGVSLGTIANWESGRTKPDANNVRDMAKTYKVSSDFLLGIA